MATWKDFRESLLRFAAQPRERRNQILFRGQSDATWPLLTTLDRSRSFAGDDIARSNHVQLLLDEFRREALAVRDARSAMPATDALELLARHHGLPSPLLDWSLSPYVSAYFAYQSAGPATPACMWMLDRAKLPTGPTALGDVDVIDDRLLLQANRRALQQQSVFLRVNTAREPLEVLLGPALFKVELAAGDRLLALADLDAMNVTATALFGDLDGAARTVRDRLQ